jgi:hypothetical protein
MASFLPENEIWGSVEQLYAPINSVEPPESPIEGSTNHANVFNRRFQTIVNRTAWLKAQISKGVLSQLITLASTARDKFLFFDSNGNLQAVDRNSAYAVGDIKWTSLNVSSSTFTDEYGYIWFFPNGTNLSNSNIAFERLYKALWETNRYSIIGGRGSSAVNDWNAGKSLVFPDVRGRILSCVDVTRTLATTYGQSTLNLVPANYPHRHNVSMVGFTASGISMTTSTNYCAFPMFDAFPQPTFRNVAGNRISANDGQGSILENFNGSQQPINVEQPSIAMNMLIFTGYKAS